jgi:leucine dehydrogenase
MNLFETLSQTGHEQIVFCNGPESGYRGIIAIHSTALGPAVGGTRFWNYEREEEALVDALRLSRGMTYKSALAGLPFGGGKAVILGDSKKLDRYNIFRAHGRFVNSLGGRYITAEDVGTATSDMDLVHQETDYVAGLASQNDDPSPWTSRGVLRGIQAAAKYLWGSDELSGKTIALQGCGNVGYCLAKVLHEAGARLIITDVDGERVSRVVREFGAEAVSPEAIYGVGADIFAPCALGAILNDETIPKLTVKAVVGSANNQLQEARHGDELEDRGILYAPDYLVNAGGVIGGGVPMLGWDDGFAWKKVDEIFDTLLAVLKLSNDEKIPTYRAADRLAEMRLQEASKERAEAARHTIVQRLKLQRRN